jgi:hypothetical protein
MPVSLPTLTQALRALGNAHVYIGDPFLLNGLAPLGQKEGNIDMAFNEEISALTAPEITGPVEHQATIRGVGITVTIPLIMGDETMWAKISPTGTAGGGWSNAQPAVTTACVIVPDEEMSVGGTFGYDGTTWTPAAPKNAIWLWRCRRARGAVPFSTDNGGKVITPVTFTTMFYGANPEGHKVFTIGNPVTQGIPLVRV